MFDKVNHAFIGATGIQIRAHEKQVKHEKYALVQFLTWDVKQKYVETYFCN